MKNASLPSKVKSISWCYRQSGILNTPSIPESVTSMAGCFAASKIERANIKVPNGITDITQLFSHCENLKTADIELPTSIENMNETFANCKSLEKLTMTIPENVKILTATFYDCFKLSGTMKIKASPESYVNCFCNTGKKSDNGFAIIVENDELKSAWENILANGGAVNVTIEIKVENE